MDLTALKRPFVPSPQQAAFLESLAEGDSHVMLAARAGTGKSTTCREGAWTLDARRSIYCCFNKHVQREFQPGLPRSCEAATLHSLGYRLIREHVPTASVDGDKVDRIAETHFPKASQRFMRRSAARLVSICKNRLDDGSDLDRLEILASMHDVRMNAYETSEVLGSVGPILDGCAEDLSLVDFDDMVWLPVVRGMKSRDSPNVLFVDEAQDLNATQHGLVDLLCPDGRMVVVGDAYQSIYAFRGADVRSLDTFQDRLATSARGVVDLPLNVTRRCPSRVVHLARRLVPDIRAADDAPEGTVATVEPDDWTTLVEIGDMVLCRTNAPLVSACYRLLLSGVKARIVGRDLGEGLASLIRRLKAVDVGDLIRRCGDHRAAEIRKLQRLRNPETAIQAVNDRCDCLLALCEGADTIAEVLARIAEMFADDPDPSRVVSLSSIHRSKGLESANVFILRPDLLPGPWAKDRDAIRQERNLLYVAITRAKSSLTFCGDLPADVA